MNQELIDKEIIEQELKEYLDGAYADYGSAKDQLEAFAALVRADEREACAKVCDELPAPDIYSDTDKSMWEVTCMDCSEAIRARGEKK